MAIGSAFGILYLLAVLGISVLVVWALVLVIIFLRLRIAQLRGFARETGEPQ